MKKSIKLFLLVIVSIFSSMQLDAMQQVDWKKVERLKADTPRDALKLAEEILLVAQRAVQQGYIDHALVVDGPIKTHGDDGVLLREPQGESSVNALLLYVRQAHGYGASKAMQIQALNRVAQKLQAWQARKVLEALDVYMQVEQETLQLKAKQELDSMFDWPDRKNIAKAAGVVFAVAFAWCNWC